jgi:asparaginyl-tRNA synthetase
MVEVKDLARHEGEEVTIGGWVEQLRAHGKVAFAVVRDGTGVVQGVFAKAELPEEVWELATTLTQESTVELTGTVRAD